MNIRSLFFLFFVASTAFFLHGAAEKSKAKKIENLESIEDLLLRHEVNIHLTAQYGQTPLQFAATSLHESMECEKLHQKQRMHDTQLAFMEAMNPRCGAGSPLQSLSKDIVEMIARNYMRPEDFSVEAIDAAKNKEIAPWAALGLPKPAQ
jgi:hypothetical protein